MLGALPLRNLSRLWGYVNSFELPVWFRPTGLRVYSTIFGCDLSEIEHADLRHYKSLGDFFYRRLKDGARPIDSAVLVLPSDLWLFVLRSTDDVQLGFPSRWSNIAFRHGERPSGRTSEGIDVLVGCAIRKFRTIHSVVDCF